MLLHVRVCKQNFGPLASKLREEKEVTEDGRNGRALAVQKFTSFVKFCPVLIQELKKLSIKKVIELARGGYTFFNVQKMHVYLILGMKWIFLD